MKVAVSIPADIFKAADELRQRMGISRSQLYSTALQRFVRDYEEEAITARLDEVYTTEASTLDRILQSIQSRSIEKV